MTRTRTSGGQSVKIGHYKHFDGIDSRDYFGVYSRDVKSLIASEGHYGYPDFPTYDVGGPFRLLHNYMQVTTLGAVKLHGSGAYAAHHYVGDVIGSDLGSTCPALSGDGSSYGSDAFRRMKPTKPTFNGLNAIYEMREVPDMLRQRFLHKGLNAIPDYWLALQFGWKPLLSDIRSMVQFQQNAAKKLAWLLRHNGKPVRTRVVLQDNTSESTPILTDWDRPNPLGSFVTNFFTGATPHSEKRTITRDTVWASAQYRYWLPDGPKDIVWHAAMMARLFGLNPSPAVIWRAMPWTWLSDWFFNVGNILDNMETGVANRLAADYFYVMRELTQETKKDFFGTCLDDPSNKLVPYHLTSTLGTNLKTRLSGDPFGFSTNPNGLNATQLSILGALGKSRL